MLTIYLILLAVTGLGSIVLSTDIAGQNSSGFSEVLTALLMLLYVFTVFALIIVTYVYMCTHFYKTMYSDQGYLTHTLPVSPLATFHVKLIVSFFWTLCSIILLIGSILLLITGASDGELWEVLTTPEFYSLLAAEFSSMGFSLGQFIGYMVAAVIFSCFSYLLMVFASASIGQLFNQYKIVAAIIAGVIIYFVEQIASLILMFVSGIGITKTITEQEMTGGALSVSFSPLLSSSLFLVIGFSAVLYVVCIVVVRKHINLD